MMNRPDISIVIPVYNRAEELRRCIASILPQRNSSFEIIVADDASTDFDYQTLRTLSPCISVLTAKVNSGPAYLRNLAINAARGTYILFLDSDTCLPSTDTLRHLLDFFASKPKTGTVGGEVRVYENDPSRVYGRLIAGDGSSKETFVRNAEHCQGQTDFLATCCCMVPAELARKVGGFDPYYVFGSEDKDFGYKIIKLGFRNYVSADCAVEHYHSPKGRNANETYLYQFTRLRFAFKHFSTAESLLIGLKCLLHFFIFYLFLPFKLAYFTFSRRTIVKEHLLGGYLILKALTTCVATYREIRSSVNIDFLKAEEMERYLSWRKRRK
ncbi:glycosyltransferase family 2 protein [Geomesophilobacter sediminis]|uniref:Glycosyltransferase n=1 Tax=Geomesophilobacter sediminis TaxID=2798584 RepID=A0A8J7LUF6_9BACT|nr:glycosyltransferase [Geomesophilobacter sediminis]MBJ6723685.1 glycosyltransferase [Geomesophilobacter sediminis]